MTYLVKIDRKTIRKNPNGGQTQFVVPGPATCTIRGYFDVRGDCPMDRSHSIVDKLEKFFLEHQFFMNRSQIAPRERVNDGVSSFECIGQPPEQTEVFKLTDKLIRVLENLGCKLFTNKMSMSVDRETSTMEMMYPSPMHLSEYESLELKCKDCECSFDHGDLKDAYDEGYDGDDEWNTSSEEVCPHCGAWDCCEIEFEKLTDEMIKEHVADD